MEQLTLGNLQHVRGGLVAVMLEKALQRMAQDLEAAPDIQEWRTVSLKIRAKPVMENRELARADVEFDVAGKVPSRSTVAQMHVRRDAKGQHRFLFNPESLENPDQLTLTSLPGVMETQENQEARGVE